MKNHIIASIMVIAVGTTMAACSASAPDRRSSAEPVESRVPVDGASLYVRTMGQGQPVIVLHGGPDFDHSYLLPELDRFADDFRLIYYDQRGRGRSAEAVRAEDVTLASDIADIDRVRQHFGLESPVVLGHSWGAVLAMEYALRYPDRVSHLILMNPAPASASDLGVLVQAYLEKLGAAMDQQREIVAGSGYRDADPDAVSARYRIHFKFALHRPEHYELLMSRMDAAFRQQGSEGILLARAVEQNLMRDTWLIPEYDLLPKLRALRVPTLVIAGGRDFIPLDIPQHIAAAIPNAKLVTIGDCGHFGYLECPADVRAAVDEFFRTAPRRK